MYASGNIYADNERDGWIYGSFMPDGLQKDDRLEIKVAKLDKSFSSPPHYAKEGTKLDIILQGSAIWVIDGEEVKLNSGDYVIIPPKTTVAVKQVLSDELIVQTIKVPSLPDDKVTV
ncbi:MAG TPA: cupin domain-containing protein [Candidatus Saccharimonadales bacterium]|nr:cupin domain-containing protein [Candidatus Saccharimonadales bacterium]